MLEHQREFVAWLAGQVVELDADAVLICGDVYDRAVPPIEAVALFEDALLQLSAQCPVIVVPGNHDSPTRLGFASSLLEKSGVHIRSTVSQIARPVILDMPGAPRVSIYGIPFLHPDLHYRELGSDRSHDGVLRAAMQAVQADRAQRPTDVSIVLAHAFVRGASTSDSERDVTVGGIGDVASEVFAGVDYVALGHLHRPQAVAGPGSTQVRYSGSPLAYSFSEADHDKSIVVIDIAPDGAVSSRTVDAPVPRRLTTIRGDLEMLLTDPRWADVEDDWIRAVLTDPRRPADAMDRLRMRFPHAIDLGFEPMLDGVAVAMSNVVIDPRIADPLEVACAFVDYVTGTKASDAERAVLVAAIDAVHADHVAR